MEEYKLLLFAVAALSSTLVAQECDICDASGRCCTADEVCTISGDKISQGNLEGGRCTKKSSLDECGSSAAWTHFCHKPKSCCGDDIASLCCEEGYKCCSLGVCCPQASTCCGTGCCTIDDGSPFTFRWYYSFAALPILLIVGCCIRYYRRKTEKRKAAKEQEQTERRSSARANQNNQRPASPPVAAISNYAFDPHMPNSASSPGGPGAVNSQPSHINTSVGNRPPPYDMHVNRDARAPQYTSAPHIPADPAINQMHAGGHHPSFNRGQGDPRDFYGPNAGQWNPRYDARSPYDDGHHPNPNRGYMGPSDFNGPHAGNWNQMHDDRSPPYDGGHHPGFNRAMKRRQSQTAQMVATQSEQSESNSRRPSVATISNNAFDRNTQNIVSSSGGPLLMSALTNNLNTSVGNRPPSYDNTGPGVPHVSARRTEPCFTPLSTNACDQATYRMHDARAHPGVRYQSNKRSFSGMYSPDVDDLYEMQESVPDYAEQNDTLFDHEVVLHDPRDYGSGIENPIDMGSMIENAMDDDAVLESSTSLSEGIISIATTILNLF